MDQTLLTLPLRGKRDVMVARQRTRQLAALLGFDLQEQACIAGGVFALAWQVLQVGAPLEICFEIQDEILRIFVRGGNTKPRRADLGALRLEKNLPGRRKLSLEDLTWAIRQLDRLTPGWMYEEMHRVNQELLATLHALQVCQAQLAAQKDEPNAA